MSIFTKILHYFKHDVKPQARGKKYQVSPAEPTDLWAVLDYNLAAGRLVKGW